MISITYIEHDGTERAIEARPGSSVMLAAVTNGVPGIDADCGGSCSCATCHVFVNEEWLSYLDFRDLESYMEDVEEFKPNFLFILYLPTSPKL